MTRLIFPAVVLLAASLSTPILAETIEGAPPDQGTSCEGTCTEPGGNGDNWTEGPSTPISSSTDTYIETSTDTFNRAEIASGGKASDKNQSNFQETTTTTTVVTTTVEGGTWINPGNNAPKPKTFTQTTVTYDSKSTDTSLSHVKPAKH